MIISASRRTDLPAFYSEWFIRRVRAGFCTVINPWNPHQVSTVSLRPEEVDAVVFWTRSPRGLLRKLPELEARGLRFYFHFSLPGYPKTIDQNGPSVRVALESFRQLADHIGADKVIWRYDPIFLSTVTGVDFHLRNFERLAKALTGLTRRCMVSFWKPYRKLKSRLALLERQGIVARQPQPEELDRLMPQLRQMSRAAGMELYSCAEELDLEPYGIQSGKCVDHELIQRMFHRRVCPQKDSGQRPACGCVQSRDIGAYDTCLFGCAYCYATQSFVRAAHRHRQHDPDAPALVPAGQRLTARPAQTQCKPANPPAGFDQSRSIGRWQD